MTLIPSARDQGFLLANCNKLDSLPLNKERGLTQLKKLLFSFLIVLTALVVAPDEAHAQLFKKKDKPKKEKKSKKKKGEDQYQGFAPPQALTPEQQRAKMISPVRKFLNQFNLSLERGYGFFSYENALTGVNAVRNPSGNALYIVPGGAGPGSGPVTGYNNWFNNLNQVEIPRIDDDAEVVNADANNLVYQNNGRLNPLTLRLSFSIRKVDKEHLKRTGERVMTDNELLRIGGGISTGRIKFKNDTHTQDVNGRLGDFRLPITKISTTKMFGSITYNAYQYSDFSLLADVSAGVWNTRSQDVNPDLVTHDPFFNIGIVFEKKVSKYFKLYIRPSFEVRQFTLANEALSVPHRFSIFTIDIGALIKYPVYPRNRFKAHRVQMEHIFNGKIYRGRSIFQRQNPRIGQHGSSRKEKVKIGRNNGND